MAHTEEEARKCWCPMTRHVGVTVGEHQSYSNRYQFVKDQPTDDHCIGRQCMWWRWVNTVDGYCGGAGKP